jgi:hypothetical protein
MNSGTQFALKVTPPQGSINEHLQEEINMKPTTATVPAVTTQNATVKPEFRIIGDALQILNVESTDLDAYRWYSPGITPVPFVFVAGEVHVITLGENELEFSRVCTMNESVEVIIVTDKEVDTHADEADWFLTQRALGQA